MRTLKIFALVLCVSFLLANVSFSQESLIKLPEPRYKGGMSVEEALYVRRSVRDFQDSALSLEDVGQMLWAACGINVDGVSGATRTAPSAGGGYSVELYLVAGKVNGLEPGVYHYIIDQHALELVISDDVRDKLSKASLGQPWVEQAPATIALVSVTSRITGRYGTRGMQYIYIDVGHIGENIHLEAESLDLGTVAIGAFSEDKVSQVLGIKKGIPVYLMPFGKKK